METISNKGLDMPATELPAELVPVHDTETCAKAISMDTLGIVASTICLIHCAGMPFLVSLLPLIGFQFLQGHAAHHILAFFVVAFAFLAIVPGYVQHRNTAILVAMLAGVSTVIFATFGSGLLFPESFELPLITVGNLIVVFTHLRNRRLCKH
jgi:hypothetical protein